MNGLLKYPLNLVEQMFIDGFKLVLPTSVRFDKREYSDLKTLLLKSGGTYKSNAFIFKEPAQDIYDRLLGGEDLDFKKKFQYFPTPEKLADKLVELANIKPGDSILEPSAGQGAIIRAINKVCDNIVDYFEIMDFNVKTLETIIDNGDLHAQYVGRDFLLGNTSYKYDKIIANPPFSKNQDIDHIRQMWKHLNFNGRIVTVCSQHWTFSTGTKELAFKDWLSNVKHELIEVKAGTFKESGTNIATYILIINKV